MKLTQLAAYRVIERGLDYYLDDNVSDIMQTGASEFQAKVLGSRKEPYIVRINLEKPRSSSCTCPYATGTNVCKHMIALYYAINPEDADQFIDNRRMYEDSYNDYDDYDEYDYYEDDYYEEDENYSDELSYKVNAEYEQEVTIF